MLRCSSRAICCGRAAVLEQAQDLGLPRGQVRVGGRWRQLVLDVHDLAEHSDHAVPVPQGHRAQVDGDALAVRADDHDLVVRAFDAAADVAREDLTGAARLLRRDDRRELLAAHVADQALGRRVHPTDDPVAVDHIRGNTNLLQCIFEVRAHVAQVGHAFESAPRRPPGQVKKNRRRRQERRHRRLGGERPPCRGRDRLSVRLATTSGPPPDPSGLLAPLGGRGVGEPQGRRDVRPQTL